MSPVDPTDPPIFWRAFLRWFCRRDLLEDVEGDLMEIYSEKVRDSRSKARKTYILEVLRLFRPRMIRSFKTQNKGQMMYKNYVKVALRNAQAYKGYTALNLLGLIVGISTSILIFLWIEDEVNKDKFHEEGEKIYSVRRNMRQSDGKTITGGNIPNPLSDVLRAEYPEVSTVTEVSWPMELLIELKETSTLERGRFISEDFFGLFSYELIEGSPEEIFDNPASIILTESLASKYLSYDRSDYDELIGKAITIEQEDELVIRGIVEDPDSRSSLNFDWLIPAQYYKNANKWMNSWENGSFNIHFMLNDPEDLNTVSERIKNEIEAHTERTTGETLWLQKFEDSYLYNNYENGKVAGGRIIYVNILMVVAIFLLVIACVNFMNLATARSSRRAKEIGLRKVMGAHRGMISRQFYTESALYSIFAVMISVGVAALTLPFYNQLVDKELSLNLSEPLHIVYLIALTVIISILAGSYPALKLSTLTLIHAIQGITVSDKAGTHIRKGLVVFQLAISFVLLFGAVIVHQQLTYALEQDAGINRKNIVSIWMEGDLDINFETYRNEILNIPGVVSVTGASGNPVRYGRSTSSAKWEGQEPNVPYEFNVINTYDNFTEDLEIEIVNGRSFDTKFRADSMNFMINETAASVMGFEDPVGKRMSVWGREGRIIGVIEDFHMNSFRREIAPLILMHDPSDVENALIKVEGNTSETIAEITRITQEMNPKYPVNYEFLDLTYENLYRTEKTISQLSGIFVIISVIIAILGLLGLSAYSTERRSKEIGVRKVHGASNFNLVMLLTKEYAILIVIAFFIAIPISYYFMIDWLNQFAYHIGITPQTFAIAGVILALVGLVTVGYKSYVAARQNPVNTLRSE